MCVAIRMIGYIFVNMWAFWGELVPPSLVFSFSVALCVAFLLLVTLLVLVRRQTRIRRQTRRKEEEEEEEEEEGTHGNPTFVNKKEAKIPYPREFRLNTETPVGGE